jgi:hypothetical protein
VLALHLEPDALAKVGRKHAVGSKPRAIGEAFHGAFAAILRLLDHGLDQRLADSPPVRLRKDVGNGKEQRVF